VSPEQRTQPAPLVGAHPVVKRRCIQDGLHEQGVDVHQRRLEQVQGEHRGLGVLAVGAGEVAVLAVFTALVNFDHGRTASAVVLGRAGSLNHPGVSGDSICWESWGHGKIIEELSA
jgi:hypothetical protein